MTISETLHGSATHSDGNDPNCPVCQRQVTIDQLSENTNSTFYFESNKFILTKDGNPGSGLYALQVTGALAGHLRLFSFDTRVMPTSEGVLRGA